MEWQLIKETVKPFLKPTVFISFGIAWLVTNGWAYVGAAAGNGAFRAVCVAYLAFIWLPTTPEKLITIPLALWFQKILFGGKRH